MNELEKLIEVVRFLIKDQDAHKKSKLTIADRRLRKALSDYDNHAKREREEADALMRSLGQAQTAHIDDSVFRAQYQKVTPEQTFALDWAACRLWREE